MEKELEDRLREVGSKLASPPSVVNELLSILDQTECLLSRVEQSPTRSMSNALRPLMKALVANELMRHSDTDVKVSVASCFSEITRITAPEAPYDDELMKEIFLRIVEAFGNLDDMSSSSFPKRVSILETVAKVRSCVIMLDLECDSLVLEMFSHFLTTIRPNHSEKVFSSMETIMTLVLEESEDISSELILCLLNGVKTDNKDILPVVRRLGEKVISNCAVKLKPYLVELSQSMGTSLNEYGKAVASICQGSSGGMDRNNVNASGEIMVTAKLSERAVSDDLLQGSAKMEQTVGFPEEVTAPEKSLKLPMSNGIVQMGNGESIVEPSSPKQNPEPSCHGDQSKMAAAASSDVLDDTESVVVKSPAVSDLRSKKTTDGGAVKDSLPSQKAIPDASRPKRGRPSSKQAATKRGGAAVAGQPVSPLQQKESEMEDNFLSSKDSDLKESDGMSNVDNVEKSAIATRDSKEKSQRQISIKGSTSKTDHEDSSQKLRKSRSTQKNNLNAKEDIAAELILKEIISSKSAMEAPKDQGNLEESAETKTRRKRDHGAKEISETSTCNKELDESLVGSRIRVWWPMDEKFYDGVVDSYNPNTKKHKIVYNDGDKEKLLLKKERWEFIDDGNKMNMEQTKDSSNPDASSEEPKRKRAKTNSSSISKETNVETPTKSGTASSSHRKGRPPKAAALNLDDSPSTANKLKEKAGRKSKDDISKSGTKLNKDDVKSKGNNFKADKSVSKTASDLKDNAHKSSKKSMDGTGKSASRSTGNSGSASSKVRKDALESKSNEDNPKTSLKSRGTTTPKDGSESKVNVASDNGKAKARESQTSGKVRASETSTGKRRKRKG